MRVEINKISAELFLELYTSVGWEAPCKEQVVKALENTLATFVAYDNENPVGMVRIIGDCGMSFYIKDFVVVPAYQSNEVLRREKYSKELFMRAVYVSAVFRLTEHDTKRVRQLISKALIM